MSLFSDDPNNVRHNGYDACVTEHQKIKYIAQVIYEARIKQRSPGTAETDWAEAERFYYLQQGMVYDEHQANLAYIDKSFLNKKPQSKKNWFRRHKKQLTLIAIAFGTVRFGVPIAVDIATSMASAMISNSKANIALQEPAIMLPELEMDARFDAIQRNDRWDRDLDRASRLESKLNDKLGRIRFSDGLDKTPFEVRPKMEIGGIYNAQNFAGADFSDMRLPGSSFVHANFNMANLYAIDLRNANLSNASLLNANLRNADLRGADLRNADLRGANLSGANFQGAKLKGANFKGAANIFDAQFNNEKQHQQIFVDGFAH